MKTLLKRLVCLAMIGGAAYLLWGQRYRIADLSNNNIRVQGTWYMVELNRKGETPYYFSERIITKNGTEWGSYKLMKNDRIEVMISNELATYDLGFPDDGNMVWSAMIDGKMTPVMRWRE